MVKGNVIVDLPGDALESLELQLFQLNSFHELQFRLPVIHFHTLVIFVCPMLQSVRDEKTSGYINTSEANLLETTSIAKNNSMDPGEPRREFGLSGQGGSNGFAPMVVIVICRC
jgi:hypothetical protein